jgi:hypothetical protein
MLFFKGSQDMGVEASLKLLDLSPDATIDDANQAYANLHRMIDVFHRDGDSQERGTRQEDMELLTCAYEKALAYISDRSFRSAPSAAKTASVADTPSPETTGLHFTINFSGDAEKDALPDAVSAIPEPNRQIVEDALSITAHRMQQAEAALPDARHAVASAQAAAEAAEHLHEQTKQARMEAIVAAKSAKSRAILLEIEAKRAMDDAIAVAKKARNRVLVARQAASDAKKDADRAWQQARHIVKSMETAAAELICAEDRLDKEQLRMKGLTHNLLQARTQMKLFQGAQAESELTADDSQAILPQTQPFYHAVDGGAAERQQMMSDLLALEASLASRKQVPPPAQKQVSERPDSGKNIAERRRHERVAYPQGGQPLLYVDGRAVPVLDLSTAGIRVAANDAIAGQSIVRGAIAFDGRQAVKVTGKVVRQDAWGTGVQLVTRIGNHIIDQERMRLSA